MNASSHMPAAAAMVLAVLCGAILSAAPRAGSEAPALELSDLNGRQLDGQSLEGRARVLIFGELYHHGTRDACVQVERVLNDPRLAAERITPILIIAQNLPVPELRQQAEGLPFVGMVLHDAGRRAFGDYRIAVLPTVVVVDARQRVVHSLPGMTSRFSDILVDALLVATGRLSRERFEQTLHPQALESLSEEQSRADRTVQLAGQLARRGLDEMAQEKYAEALALWPTHVEARLGLGRLFIKNRRIADAETQYRKLLEADPDLAEAALGVAFVQAQRGGDELPEAERVVREVLARDGSHARGHYLLGMIHEKRGREEDAAASYRRAAEILLQRHGGE
jgi:tetratricopeptide (TPR) repeat protein